MDVLHVPSTRVQRAIHAITADYHPLPPVTTGYYRLRNYRRLPPVTCSLDVDPRGRKNEDRHGHHLHVARRHAVVVAARGVDSKRNESGSCLSAVLHLDQSGALCALGDTHRVIHVLEGRNDFRIRRHDRDRDVTGAMFGAMVKAVCRPFWTVTDVEDTTKVPKGTTVTFGATTK